MTPEALGRALGAAPDPELARIAISRVGERRQARDLLERPEVIPAAARLLGFSRSAADFFLAHPQELESLADPSPRTLDRLSEELEADVGALGAAAGLRRFRRRASYRIAARDLAGVATDEVDRVMAELTAVAEACLRVATAHVPDAGPTARDSGFAVIGMGKLGGAELNYSSDVDVLFVHRGIGAPAQESASTMAAKLIRLLSESTGDGVALRVDPDLRPDGRAGALSRSLESMLEYYASHAQTWERQALLKARPVAGDMELGAEFVDGVGPLAFPAVLPASAVGDVRATKARIEERVRALGKEGTEIKRGRGGIRDVEFAVQLLQLVHGRHHPRLRHANTLGALDALSDEGFVRPADARALAASYRFLRVLEHRLQMVRDLQTHELPASRAALAALARSMGLSGPEDLRAEHARHADIVRTLHERLFYRPLLEAFSSTPAPLSAMDRSGAEEVLVALGFDDPEAAYETLTRALDPETRSGKVLATLFPMLAPVLSFADRPDAAVVRFGRVAEALRHDDRLADQFADRPDAARRLAALVAASSALADMLASRPNLTRALFELPVGERPLFPGDDAGGLVRVAGAYASGELSVPDLGRRLATVADGVIAAALEQIGPGLPFAVIGLGKLGGEELSFASDLDVVFVYEGEGPDDFRVACEAGEGVLAGVRASGWQGDADLRPEGRSGPLARSMASYLEYWERWAETWEYQSLLRARLVAGDESLGRRFLSNAADFAYPRSLTFEQLAEIRRMRVRMEEERVRPRDAGRFHFKLGYGSLADVQFAVELSLMRHGNDHPEVRRSNTLEALEALAAGAFLEASVARSLADAYVFLSRIKATLEIERRLPVDALPPTPEAQAALARRLGYGERARTRFLEDYRRVTHRARRAMERVFYPEEVP